MIFFQLTLVGAVALFFSVFLSPFVNFFLTFAVYLLGSTDIAGSLADDPDHKKNPAAVALLQAPARRHPELRQLQHPEPDHQPARHHHQRDGVHPAEHPVCARLHGHPADYRGADLRPAGGLTPCCTQQKRSLLLVIALLLFVPIGVAADAGYRPPAPAVRAGGANTSKRRQPAAHRIRPGRRDGLPRGRRRPALGPHRRVLPQRRLRSHHADDPHHHLAGPAPDRRLSDRRLAHGLQLHGQPASAPTAATSRCRWP